MLLVALALAPWPGGATAATPLPAAPPTQIIAAENFYADVAQQIAGPDAGVRAILDNPDTDPHLFEAAPSIARSLATARIVILNGLGYDPWMTKLLEAAPMPGRQVINVAALLGRGSTDNPHLWYDPATMPAVAQALTTALVAADPAQAAQYRGRLADFLRSLLPLDARIAALHARFAGMPVTATEPVFADMAAAIGLVMRNLRFQLAVMNDTEPSPAESAAMETDLSQHHVRALLVNSQTSNAATQRLRRIAGLAHVPVVLVRETEPPGLSYQAWMLRQLDALEAALSSPG